MVHYLKHIRCHFQKGTPPKFIYLISNFFFLASVPARLVQLVDEHEKTGRSVEEGFLIWAVPGSWFYLIFFAGFAVCFTFNLNVHLQSGKVYYLALFFQFVVSTKKIKSFSKKMFANFL